MNFHLGVEDGLNFTQLNIQNMGIARFLINEK